MFVDCYSKCGNEKIDSRESSNELEKSFYDAGAKYIRYIARDDIYEIQVYFDKIAGGYLSGQFIYDMVRSDHDSYLCDYDEYDIVNDPAFMKITKKSFSSHEMFRDDSGVKNKEVTVHVDKY